MCLINRELITWFSKGKATRTARAGIRCDFFFFFWQLSSVKKIQTETFVGHLLSIIHDHVPKAEKSLGGQGWMGGIEK